jgi:nucleotide-binding universal stress UspA family protein
MSTIVVGVDGSPASTEALRWALDEARLRNASVRVVQAWSFPHLPAAPGMVPPLVLDPDELRRQAEELAGRTVSEVAGPDPEVEVDTVAVHGSPAHSLVEAAANADLLVVGSRGHGGFAGLLLGSVSQQCAHHAPCPVVIVRARKD